MTENVETPKCNCPRFSDTGGFRIADLTCPIHGVNGTDPGDGPWEPENVETRCVPLCNADNAHGGVAVPWWKHDQLCPARQGRRRSALDVARRLGHELPTEAEQAARLDREYPAADTDCSLGDAEKSCWTCSNPRWEIVRGVTCVVCPDCAFTFSAEHTDDTPDGGYSCPNCENVTTPENVEEPTVADRAVSDGAK